MQVTAHPWTQVVVGDAVIVVSTNDPMAVVQRRGAEDIALSWPRLDVGLCTPTLTVYRVPDGVWLSYSGNTDMAETFARPRPAAIHLAVDGKIRVIELHERTVVGATNHGLWSSSGTDLPDIDDASQWSQVRRFTITTADGIDSHVTCQAVPLFASDVNGDASLWVYPSAPTLGDDGAYNYRYARIPLPRDSHPETLSLADAVEYTEAEFMATLRSTDLSSVAQPRGLDVVAWPLVDVPEHAQTMAVDAVVKDFANLDTYWHAEDGSTEPLSTGLADPRVEVLHPWPHTLVQVSFTHPRFARGRMQRTVRIFDKAGRIAPNPHSAILLMEDLDAGPLPPDSTAINGILEI